MPTRIEPTEDSAKGWAAKPFLAEEIREAVAGADILLIPSEGYGDRADLRFFPAGTSELFRFLKERVSNGARVEVAATDADYREVARHADVIFLPNFLLTCILAPVFARLLSEYLLQKLGSRRDSMNVKTSITLRDEVSQRSVRVDYDGPVNAFEETIVSVAKRLSDGTALPSPKTDDTTQPSDTDQAPPPSVS